MVDLSRLLNGAKGASDRLRYGADVVVERPIVVWNLTPACNLKCRHCYAAVNTTSGVLPLDVALKTVDGLAELGCAALLLSGGEPLMYPHLFELAGYARQKGIRVTLSTNGTLITSEVADRLKALDVTYVGISIDGTEEVHDTFRGVPGAYQKSLNALRICRDAGVKVGLRVTMTRNNVRDIDAILDLMQRERFQRICFYHLVYTGRGGAIRAEDLSHEESRAALDKLMARTEAAAQAGIPLEILTVDNHCDAPYVWLKLAERGDTRAEEVLQLIRHNGGNASGKRFFCISWDGTIYPDQFWRTRPVGSVLNADWVEQWRHPPEGAFLAQLRQRHPLLQGRCATCRFQKMCAGNLRARADEGGDNVWLPDPACYLTDDEICGELL